MKIDLEGKVAVVTGATRGIGRATAELLASCGARVVITSRKAQECDAVAAEIGLGAIGIACDMSDPTAISALAQRVEAELGGADILVLNAALNPAYGPMSSVTAEQFGRIMAANVAGPLWLVNALAPGMAQKGQGAIVVVSSIVGLRASRTIGAYGLSKAAGMQLVRNLAVEWGPRGVRVNGIAPGLVRTKFAKVLWENDAMRGAVERAAALGRIGEPEDIARAALFLVSDLASYMAGQTLVVDGGVTIADPLDDVMGPA